MIWKTQTHQFTATLCQRTGKTCPALARWARAMAQSMAATAPAMGGSFEIDGSAELTHCDQGCTARFRANADQLRLYCGADPDTDMEKLEDYADLMFGTDHTALPASFITSPPCAMLEAIALCPATIDQPAVQAIV
jgi:hypothetical protein